MRPPTFAGLREAFAALASRRARDRELDDEIQFHLEHEARRLEQSGMSPADARRHASLTFGGVQQVKEAVHDERGSRPLDDVAQDLRFAFRSLRRRRGFTAMAVLTLALGIGATTALFGVVKAVLLTPLPYRDPSGVVVLWSAWKGFDQTWLSYDEYEGFDAGVPAFADVGLFSDGAINLTDGDRPERIRYAQTQANVFDILGVQPMLGRGFTAEEDRPNGPNVIVLSHALWMRRFDGDSGIVGRPIQVNGEASVVVGVMPAGFKLPLDFGGAGPTEAWQPLATDAESNGATPGPAFTQGGGSHGFYGVARLAPGATVEQANAGLRKVVAEAGESVYPATMQYRAFAVPVADQVTGRIRPALLLVFGAVGFVLLIACANVAGLMLVRGEARRRELAVRIALGASAARLRRLLLAESVVLAGIGGALGIALAALTLWLARSFAPADLPRFDEARLDPLVLLFALCSSVGAAILAGLLPALQASHVQPAGDLKDGSRGATTGVARLRWRQGLVAVEIALAVVLVCGAGLMVRTVANLFAVDAGIDPRHVLTMRLSTPAAFYPDRNVVETFHAQLRREVAALPGVRAAGAVRILPLASEMGDWGVAVEGYTPPPNQGTPSDWQIVTPGYFEAMGLELVQGRFLEDRDDGTAPLALVVNRRFVEMYLPGRDPIGRAVRIGGSPDSLRYRIVGVVGDVRHNGLTREVKAQFYAPLAQFARAPGNVTRSFSLVVRTAGDPMALAPAVRGVIRAIDPRVPIADVRAMEDVVAASIAQPRFAMTLLGAFGALALLLAAVGIFGIVAQLVAARSHEFGIRAALGASPKDLVLLGMRGGLVQTAIGLAAGLAGALLATRAMAGLLEGVTPTDVPTYVTVLLVTGGVALLATVGPARRAGRTDPMQVLHEG